MEEVEPIIRFLVYAVASFNLVCTINPLRR